MVGWFNPRQLLSTGVQALLSEVIGSYADKRELEAALRGNPGPHTNYESHEEIWLDFVADLGDCFDSTYTVASLRRFPRPFARQSSRRSSRSRCSSSGAPRVEC